MASFADFLPARLLGQCRRFFGSLHIDTYNPNPESISFRRIFSNPSLEPNSTRLRAVSWEHHGFEREVSAQDASDRLSCWRQGTVCWRHWYRHNCLKKMLNTLQPAALGISTVFWTLSTATILLRLWSRFSIIKSFGWDDALMSAILVSS